jgi:drug/metabolite transporter (DMT)-like permease
MASESAVASGRASTVQVVSALALVYVVWGSTYLGIRWALEGGWPPLLMAGVRFLVAGVLMYAFLRWRGEPAPTRAQWRNLAVMSVLLLGLGNGMVCIAEQTVSSGLAAVAVASAPLWMGLFSAMRGDRPVALEWAGLAIGFLGVAWLNAGSSLTASPWGLVALLVAPLAWAFGSIWSRGRDLPSPFMSAAGQMLCAGVFMPLAGLAIGERMHVWLLHHVRPTLAGSYAYVNPVIAVLLGAWLASERFGAHDIGAMAVVVAGVFAITLAKARRPAAPAAAADA